MQSKTNYFSSLLNKDDELSKTIVDDFINAHNLPFKRDELINIINKINNYLKPNARPNERIDYVAVWVDDIFRYGALFDITLFIYTDLFVAIMNAIANDYDFWNIGRLIYGYWICDENGHETEFECRFGRIANQDDCEIKNGTCCIYDEIICKLYDYGKFDVERLPLTTRCKEVIKNHALSINTKANDQLRQIERVEFEILKGGVKRMSIMGDNCSGVEVYDLYSETK